MLYRIIFILILSQTFLLGQSLFNRWVGTDPFTGSARSTAIGHTHLLNSSGSSNVRFNPANLSSLESKLTFDMQWDRSSIFERWSMPVRDFFGDFLTEADYVANEFTYHGFRGGLSYNLNILNLGKVGIGIYHAPLTNFTYQYSEEVRGAYDPDDGEYASKDPIVGYQNIMIDGAPMVSSVGCGIKMRFLGDINLRLGGSINFIQSSMISDRVEVDTLYADVTNLTTVPDIDVSAQLPNTDYIAISTILNLTPNMELGASWEGKAMIITNQSSLLINDATGLFQYFDDDENYMVSGLNYVKPEIRSIAMSINSDIEKMLSINFEANQISYDDHLNLNDYNQFKFGFEYITQMGTPIRGGLVYRTAYIPALKPVSMFTFGTGKTWQKLSIDVAGTYCFQSFYYPDLFVVEGDVRENFDLVRDSQFDLQLALTYHF